MVRLTAAYGASAVPLAISGGSVQTETKTKKQSCNIHVSTYIQSLVTQYSYSIVLHTYITNTRVEMNTKFRV